MGGLVMFVPEIIRSRMRVQLSEPLRIVTSTGETFDVRHPDFVLVGDTRPDRGLSVTPRSVDLQHDHPHRVNPHHRIAGLRE